jgi:MoxR-like ATPase
LINKDTFVEWLTTSTNINPYTIGRYSQAIDTISSELGDYELNKINLYTLTNTAIINTIIQNPEFKKKNEKGHRMYSTALNHLKKFIEHYYNSELQTNLPGGGGTVATEDTILIKIGVSYKEGMIPEELYHATSVSWVIGENRLRGEIKYYCAVFNNEIKEVYNFTGYEKDLHPDNIGRFILFGEIADESIRSNILNLNVRDIHKGLGNPIKYVSMENLLKLANNDSETATDDENPTLNHQMIKLLFKRLANEKREIRTLSTNKPNWITKIDDSGIFVETETSRLKFSRGEKNKPYALITYNFLLAAWEEFLKVRKASANDFIKTKGRSRFVMAFFNELPFVEKALIDDVPYIRLKELTTDQLPEANLEQTLELLNEIINQDLDPKLISHKYNEDSIKRLKLRARQGLKILGFLNEDYRIQQSILDQYINSDDKIEFLSKRILQHSYFSVIYQCLSLLYGVERADKYSFLTEIGMLIVRNSMGTNLMVPSVAQSRTRNMLNWLKQTGLVDEEWNVISNDIINQNYSTSPNASIVREHLPIYGVIEHINRYIAGKGFYYEKDEIINLFLSLKTKPFVIISGISGTGKTKIVQWFAESVGATEKNGQFSLIPIRPDWNDGSDLLGYVDIKGEFKEGPLTKVIKNAHQNPDLPYFVLLDEMNLARVEYYFSDILSVMESRKWENGEVVSSTLLSSDVYGKDLTLPNNLYIIGTVNMDETTHPFSKKVLDRANTIEFNRVNLGNLSFLTELEEVEPKVISQDRFASKYLHLKNVYKENKEIVARATDELVRINESLQLINAHVGYRVRDEICFYLAYNEGSNLMKFENAFDHCILQKILPRIAGSDTRVEQLLRGLFSLFANQDYEEDAQNDLQNAKYPRSAVKVAEMLGRLRNDGFTSFWVS